MSSTQVPVKKQKLVERLGQAYLRRLDRLSPVVSSADSVHILNDDERRSLVRIERFAILWAALIGVMSALVCAFASVTTVYLLGEKSSLGLLSNWRHYALLGTIIGVATVAEIILMYMNALIAVHRLSREAGIQLFDDSDRSKSVANAIVNAALDLPLVTDGTLFVRPGYELDRWKIVIAALVYKLKVSLTYYLAKFLVQRTFGRMIVRWAIELVAVPIYAFWNAWTTRKVLHQARVCVMGPSAIAQFLDELQLRTTNRSEKLNLAISLTSGITIGRNPELHPNVWVLSQELWKRFGKPDISSGFSEQFISVLAQLDVNQQQNAICYLIFNTVIDGQLSRGEMELAQYACRRCGLVLSSDKLQHVVKKFVDGVGISPDDLLATFTAA